MASATCPKMPQLPPPGFGRLVLSVTDGFTLLPVLITPPSTGSSAAASGWTSVLGLDAVVVVAGSAGDVPGSVDALVRSADDVAGSRRTDGVTVVFGTTVGSGCPPSSPW